MNTQGIFRFAVLLLLAGILTVQILILLRTQDPSRPVKVEIEDTPVPVEIW